MCKFMKKTGLGEARSLIRTKIYRILNPKERSNETQKNSQTLAKFNTTETGNLLCLWLKQGFRLIFWDARVGESFSIPEIFFFTFSCFSRDENKKSLTKHFMPLKFLPRATSKSLMEFSFEAAELNNKAIYVWKMAFRLIESRKTLCTC